MNLIVNGLIFVTLMSMMLHSDAAIVEMDFKNPAHPGKCFISKGLILAPGDKAQYPDAKCTQVVCKADSKGFTESCGAIGLPSSCKMGQVKFPDADYPKCCDREIACQQ